MGGVSRQIHALGLQRSYGDYTAFPRRKSNKESRIVNGTLWTNKTLIFKTLLETWCKMLV